MSLYHFLFDNPYYLIFHNSLQSAILLSLRSDNAWFAALQFGSYNMVLATAVAFAGSMLGMTLNYGLGYYISRWRSELPAFSETMYLRVGEIFRNKLFILMLIPPVGVLEMMPGFSLFVVVNGMFRVPPKRALTIIMVARILYYSYYLLL